MTQRFDADLGAYQMDHRDYDPVLKRFHIPDLFFLECPEQCVSSPHECNLYSYAKENPVSFVDLSGKNATLAGLGVAATAYGVYDWFKTNVPTSDSIVPTGSPVDYAAGAVGGAAGTKISASFYRSTAVPGFSGGSSSRAENSVRFNLHPRVEGQLNDSRLGDLAGKFNEASVNSLLNSKSAMRLMDNKSGHINIIQNVEDKLIRITVPRDEFKAISVGPIRENQIMNGIESGRFTPMK